MQTEPGGPALLDGAPAEIPLPARGILHDVLFRGAGAAAAVPARDEAETDESPGGERSVRQTLAELSAPGRTRSRADSMPAWDALFADATRYLLLGPYGYRVVAIATGLLAIHRAHRVAGFGVVLVLGLVLVVWQVAAVVALLRSKDVSRRLVVPLMVGDLAVSAAANLVVAGAADQTAVALSWKCLLATSVLWTIGGGLIAGLSVVAFGAVLQEAMVFVHHRYVPANGIPLIANALGDDIWLVSSVAATALGVAALAVVTRRAMTLGVRTGRRAERARILRGVHDTVLQTLETIGLQSGGTTDDAGETLDEVGRIASAEAIRIRRSLDQIDRRPAELVDGLAELVAEAASLGLRVEMAFTLPDESIVGPRHREALVEAAREAIVNIHKHAGTQHAVLSVIEIDGGAQVTVRDHGCGFDSAPAGFGTSQSIVGRITELGGRASITSKSGSGTRVVLWVPGG